jgi:hypothetical protein
VGIWAWRANFANQKGEEMGFLGISPGDELTDTLRDVFGANIVRVPEERIKPLAVVAAQGDKASWLGSLSEILVGKARLPITPSSGRVASLSGKQSKKVDFKFGLGIMQNFLGAFGVPSVGIDVAFKNASEVAFSFNDVVRWYVDRLELGSVLQNQYVDMTQPSAVGFFGDPPPWELLLIDSTITSSDFTISVDSSSHNDVQIDLGAIQQIVDKASVGMSVSLAAGRVLSFKGPTHLAFAFTCIQLYLNAQGKISVLSPDDEKRQLAEARGAGGAEQRVLISPPRIVLGPKRSMIEWNEWPRGND